jgi:hypothetical protein
MSEITSWINYRRNTNFKTLIPMALQYYRERYGEPTAIMVHPTWEQEAINWMAIHNENIEVRRNGGTLVGEVWLPLVSEPRQLTMTEADDDE